MSTASGEREKLTMQSIWQMEEFPPLRKTGASAGTHRTDVAVIGAGMAGVLTAYQLQQRGARVVLLKEGGWAAV